ncbi:MAG: hypothetical protein HOV80_06855, partial [Polyangiaceae bacterium]|nr:hypothetical protein [Polyangiaceae bacterium]
IPRGAGRYFFGCGIRVLVVNALVEGHARAQGGKGKKSGQTPARNEQASHGEVSKNGS